MGGHCRYQSIRWIILLLGFGLTGCPDTLDTGRYSPESPAIPVAEITSPSIVPAAGQSVSYEICADLTTWMRPELTVQQQTILQDPRYGQALEQDSLSSLSEQFWTQSIISFTTYGLSARVEPLNLSGVWTATADRKSVV